ncbi:MAG: 50S ribosomal protein L18e [Candidatus Thorarchaeota archaeon]|nr:50S ribosomal protein L18e [Candidatus Thorarchaeota archaeon]
MVRTGSTDPNVRALVNALRKASTKNDARVWKRVAELVSRPTRQRAVVNLGKIERHSNDGDVIVVPGKVLGAGVLTHKVVVAALSASASARATIVAAGGSLITIDELVTRVPKGSGVTIIT